MKGGRLLIVGGPAGFYGPTAQRDQRVVHFVSEESKSSRDAHFTIPAKVGAVILTRFLAHRLSDAVIAACKDRQVPCYGVFRSPGSVTRLLASVLDWKHYEGAHGKEEMPAKLGDIARIVTVDPDDQAFHDEEEQMGKVTSISAAPAPTRALPAAVVASSTAPEVEVVVTDPTEREILNIFRDARAALALAEELTLSALRKARENEKRADANNEAAQRLAALRELLVGSTK